MVHNSDLFFRIEINKTHQMVKDDDNNKSAKTSSLNIDSVDECVSFKEQLINDIIPRIEKLKETERLHINWLIDNNAPMDFIQLSQKNYNHVTQRIDEYKQYAERL